MPSPCIRVCQLDTNNQCLGCKRTLQEIADWPKLPSPAKQAVVDDLKNR